jgi:hypothetical protein
MISPINNIVRSTLPQQSLNVLLFVCDGHFEYMLCEALPQHQFYSPITDNNKPQGWNFSLYPQPHNLHFIPSFDTSDITSKIDFDLVICHYRTSQYDIAKQIADLLHVNVVVVEHVINTSSLDFRELIPLIKKTKQNTNVFVADVVNWFKIPGTIIKYGVKDIYGNNKQNKILMFNVEQQDIDNIASHIDTPIVVQDMGTISQTEYHDSLQTSKFYLNLSAELTTLQPNVLYAMSAGCVVISMASPAIQDIITHMQNGIIIRNMEELLAIWKNIHNTDLQQISINANKYIVDNYSPLIFKEKWHDLLMTTYQKTYIR